MRAAVLFLLIPALALAADKPSKSKAKPRPKVKPSSMTVDAKGEPLPKGKVNVMGRNVSWESFVSSCRERSAKGLKNGAYDGKPAKIEGAIASIGEKGMVLNTGRNDAADLEPVAVSFSDIGGADNEAVGFRPGNICRVWGIADEGGSVRCWYTELAPPGVSWKAELRNPGVVYGGKEQVYHVDCVVVNTGEQVLRNVVLGVRLMQVQSPNDEVKKIKIPALAPGASVTVTADFDWYNYEVIGKTSVPVGQASVLGYEL